MFGADKGRGGQKPLDCYSLIKSRFTQQPFTHCMTRAARCLITVRQHWPSGSANTSSRALLKKHRYSGEAASPGR
jgi:hypothetical protein